MTRRGWGIAVVAALVAAILVWLWPRGNPAPTQGKRPDPSREVEETPEPSPAEAPPESAAIPPSAITGRDSAPSDAVPTAIFEVTVLDSNGRPAVGADVRVLESDPAGEGRRPLPPLRGRAATDAEGSARIEVPGGIGGGFVWAALGDEAALTPEHVHLRPGARHSVTLELAPSRRVRGCVVDGDRRRVAADSVRLLVLDPLSTMSSSIGPYAFEVEPESLIDGAFEFAPLGEVPRLWTGDPARIGFRVRAEGFLPLVVWMPEEQVRAGAVELALTRPGTVRGRCVDASGQAVAGAIVAPPAGLGLPSRTGDDGRFELSGVPESGIEFSLSGPGHSVRRVPVPPFDGRAGVDLGDLILEVGETVRGLVVDADGVPVAGASVHVSGVTTTTDADGRFVADHVGPLPWSVYAQAGSGMDEDCRRASMRIAERPADIVRIAFAPGRWVRFEVDLDDGGVSEGNPWVDAYVHPPGWKRGDPEDGVRHRWTRLRRFRLEAPSTGEWIALVTRNGYEPVSVPVVVSGDREPVVRGTLRRATTVAPEQE